MPAWVRWQPPKLRPEEDAREARIDSVDLFYDLIFIVVVAQLAAGLSADISAYGFLTFVLLFMAAVRVWSSETFYSDHFENIDVSYRMSVFLAMVAAGGMAVAASQGLGRLFPLFALSTAAARLVVVAQWLRAGRHEPSARPLARRYLLLYGAVALVWIAASVVPPGWRLLLAVIAVLVDMASPALASRLQGELARFSGEHLSDRFGAFFLLVLGQIILAAVLEMTRLRQPSFGDLTAGVLIFMLAFAMWWVYIDHVVGRPLREGHWWNAAWTYLNIPLFMATGAFGSAALMFVTLQDAPVPGPVRWLLAGTFAAVILFSGLAEIALEPLPTPVPVFRTQRHTSRLAVVHGLPAVLALFVAYVSEGLSAVPVLLLLLVVAVVAVLLGEYVRAGQ